MFFMDKNTPHCKLSIVKQLVEADQVRTTRSAREGAAALGFDFDEKRWPRSVGQFFRLLSGTLGGHAAVFIAGSIAK
jgi:motility quorum-sensing regulator/GCU-specific mRNA interferase toxin